ncbi:MAG: fimbria/pilus outer membrane usher protein [Rouxiella aceris]|uniref:fimbria/pilus outer membrane usher protein n=1 Tax=Rouxiella aceris TaxID=2703884 RepID=UPI0028412916|nr:fimbria/pilus outer membrane usher protein [Rouxiella aceris]MDR3434575.1 fimbria/pilus outer membrane usher protein [Rouxiella aceris]
MQKTPSILRKSFQDRRGILYASGLSLVTLGVQGQEYNALPAPPRAATAVSSTTYYLTLVINGQSDNQVVPVIYRNGSYLLESGILAKNHLHLNGQQQGLVDITTLPQVKSRYNASAQQLLITVPDDWLPRQDIAGNKLIDYTPAQSGNGLLFNYDSYYSDPHQGSRSVATYLEQRLFSGVGMLSNTGTWRYTLTNSGADATFNNQDGYLRYDTYWRYSDDQRMIGYQLGDVVSNSLTWSNSARMGGLRISRNFAVRPDIVTYPLVRYSGTASVPTAVDLFINGYKASSSQLNSGPFTLTNVPYINGAGEATVVTTDALGRQVTTSVPFYVSNQLLRQGLSDFDFSLGKVRKNYGIDSRDYDDPAISGIYRFGLSNALTLSTHGEATKGLRLAGAGADIGVWQLGTLSLSASQSQTDRRLIATSWPAEGSVSSLDGPTTGNADTQPIGTNSGYAMANQRTRGRQYTLGYSYYSTQYSLALQRLSRTDGYQDINAYTSNTALSLRADQATFSVSPFGQSNGTVGIGYFDVEAADRSHSRLLNLSYSRSLWAQSSLFLSLNKTLGTSGYSAQLQLIIPFDFGGNLNIGSQRDSAGHYQQQIGASKSAPTESGLGWDMAYASGNNAWQQADATWKTRYATVQGGIYGPRGEYTNWADISGSLVFIDHDLFMADKINDAFAVVNTDHYPGVPVLYENQKVGTSDKNGHLLLPNVSAFYPAKIDIDPLPLPVDVIAPVVSQRVSVREGSGVVVNFPVKKVLSASIRLLDVHGQPLKLGTLVSEQHSRQTTVVGYDGLVYFSNLQTHNRLRIKQEDRTICLFTFDLDRNSQRIAQLGPLVCRPTHNAPQEDKK